jgi:TPP-dependent pyruvate/acetoin dehydrogenase alpha subunit
MLSIYRPLYLIRRFEEIVLENFPRGIFFGTTHTYLGQEANAVGVISHLQDDDIVFSNHRGHGHFLAYGGSPRALFAELMGKVTGVCGGRGGSQHLQWRNFYSNGIQGGIAPVATGMALAEKRKGTDAVAVCFLGDGTLGEGTVYEALNLASLWQAPILYIVEDNRIAQTTPTELALAGRMDTRFAAFGIPVADLDTSDVLEISAAAERILADVRTRKTPHALILHTCRFGPHSKGDDTRPPNEVAALRQQRDPIIIHASRLTSPDRAAIENEVNTLLAAAFQQALGD